MTTEAPACNGDRTISQLSSPRHKTVSFRGPAEDILVKLINDLVFDRPSKLVIIAEGLK